mmetsp:Transcript_24541/g.79230  ORF Transcript_24541/g.79230 Transcript_24541/m.79230 type:complete len:325 (-) Transcript_24541:1470-2444(-)
MHRRAHNNRLVAALLAVFELGAGHRVGREAVQHVRRLEQVLPQLPLSCLDFLGGGRLGGAELKDGARPSDGQVGQHHKLGPGELGVADMRRVVVEFGGEVADGLHRSARHPLNHLLVERIVNRPLVRCLPLWLALPLLCDEVVRLAEDGHIGRRGAQKVEAGADGGAPLLDHVARPAPDALADDVPIAEQRLGAAEEQGVEVDEEHVEAGFEHPQPEALPLADDRQLGDGCRAQRDARQQQPRRVGEPAEDVTELPVHGHQHEIAQAQRASRLCPVDGEVHKVAGGEKQDDRLAVPRRLGRTPDHTQLLLWELFRRTRRHKLCP